MKHRTTRVRISATSPLLSIANISEQVGFTDSNYFLPHLSQPFRDKPVEI